MKRRWIRYGVIPVSAAMLTGVLGFTAAGSGTAASAAAGTSIAAEDAAGKPGKPDKPGKPEKACAGLDMPVSKDKQPPKHKRAAAGTVEAPEGKVPVDRAKPTGREKGKPVDKPGGVLVCGEIVKIDGGKDKTVLTIKTGTGPVPVVVDRHTVVVKGDQKVPPTVLKPGLQVAIKAEVSKDGTAVARAILLP